MSASTITLLRVEMTKLIRQPTTWILSGVLVAYLLVIATSFTALLRAPDVEGFDRESFVAPIRADPLAFTAALFSGTVTILLVILAATIVAQETSRGTLRTLLLAGATRQRFALAKFALMLALATLLATIGTAFSLAAIAAFSAAIGEQLLTPDTRTTLVLLRGLFITFAGWGILATAATLWRGSLGIGIGVTLGLLIGGDVIGGLLANAGDLGTLASRLLPNTAMNSFNSARPITAATWTWASANLAFYLLLIPYLAMRQLERTDAVSSSRA